MTQMKNSTEYQDPIQVGAFVKRHASDYTAGRKGYVLDMKDGRCRVHWISASGGRQLNIRTWVGRRFISCVDESALPEG